MVDIGDLGGTAPDAIDIQFGYFGSKFSAHPELGELILVEFLEGAIKIDEHSPQALTAVKDFLRQVVAPDDFDLFWRAAIRNRQTTQQLMTFAETLIEKVVEATTERPTSQLSDSSAGPSPTAESSEADASSRVVHRLESSGRPDLALAVLARQDASTG